jgi:hypothetical protein
MEIDSLVTALEHIDHAARDFLRLSDMPGAPGLFYEDLNRWCAELDHPYRLDPAFDRQREAVHAGCVATREALASLALKVGPVPHAVVRRVRELSHTIGAMLPGLVRVADRG